jgi:ABC-2 type transport system ATP-binding protein
MENQQIVILDEPYNALDYKTNHDITDVIKQLKEEGRTVLLNSHQHEYLERLCDTIYCLHEKKIVPFNDELRKLYFSI